MLNTNKTLRRAVSIGAMACGIVLIILCLVLAFTGSTLSFRGPLLVIGAVAFFLALLCTSKIRGVGLFRAAFFLPTLIGGIVLGYIWQFIFNKVFLTLFNTNFSVLDDANGTFLAIIGVYGWQYAGLHRKNCRKIPRCG